MADESNDLQLEAPTAEADAPRRTIAVVDGNSLMHRAFHAIPPTMTAPDGRHTNAIFGFVSMFVKLVETFAPDGVICAFDKGKPSRAHGDAAAVQGAAPAHGSRSCTSSSPW